MGIRNLNRIQPVGPVQGYRSFGMVTTRRVQATCADVMCEHNAKGWVTVVPPGSPDEGVLVAACDGRVDGIRRQWRERCVSLGGFHEYHFDPGQPCLRASTHTVPWSFAFHHRDGDWRGNPSGLVVAHPDGQSWVDEFGQHQERIVHQRERYGAE
ncbi:MAG: hypothetical protein V4515_14425 [Chloroflexota bacterium]